MSRFLLVNVHQDHVGPLLQEGLAGYRAHGGAAADENGVWRTYVPVRFAAQAFACAVGWDQDTSTAIIVDTEKLLETALEGKEFTYLEKLMEYSKRYNEGIWDMDMTMDGSLTLMGANMPMSVAASGTVADETKLEMDMGMKLDMTQLLALAQQMGGDDQLAGQLVVFSSILSIGTMFLYIWGLGYFGYF